MYLLDSYSYGLQLSICLFLIIEVIVLSYLLGRLIVGWIIGFKVHKIKLGIGNEFLSKVSHRGTKFILGKFPIGGYILFDDESIQSENTVLNIGFLVKRVCLLFAGPLGNLVSAIMIMALSFIFYGDSNYTMQVVNIIPNSPATKTSMQRGDIVRSVNGVQITKFDQGRQLISDHPNLNILLNIERKTDYIEFNDYKRLLDYLRDKYQPRDYIRINEADKEPRWFYAKEPALRYIEKINLNDISVEISTRSQFLDITVKPDSSGTIGIGIKPYSITESVTSLGYIESISLAVSHVNFIVIALVYELGSFINKLIAQGSFYLETPIMTELLQFAVDISRFDINLSLRYLSIICLLAAIINLLPFPKSAGYKVIVYVGRILINDLCKYLFNLDTNLINEDVENYLKLLYFGALALVLLLIITHSFPTLSRLF